MSCRCEQKKIAGDLERMRKTAKAYARLEGTTVALYRNSDGTYGFCAVHECEAKIIVEYISQY